MSLIVLALASLGLVAYVIHAIRVSSINWIALLLIVGVVFGSGYVEARYYMGTNQLNYLLVNITDENRVEVKCQRPESMLLDISPQKAYKDKEDKRVIHFKYEVCQNLVQWMDSDGQEADSETAYNLYLFLHTAGHIPKIIDSSVASCKAEQRYVEVAQFVGASEEEAQRMFDDYKKNWYPSLPDSYKTLC